MSYNMLGITYNVPLTIFIRIDVATVTMLLAIYARRIVLIHPCLNILLTPMDAMVQRSLLRYELCMSLV